MVHPWTYDPWAEEVVRTGVYLGLTVEFQNSEHCRSFVLNQSEWDSDELEELAVTVTLTSRHI